METGRKLGSIHSETAASSSSCPSRLAVMAGFLLTGQQLPTTVYLRVGVKREREPARALMGRTMSPT